jgi:hypothetical protein
MDFAPTLRQSDTACNKLSRCSGLSEPYIYRLEIRERTGRSRDVVIMLGMALARSGSASEIWDIDELLISAGYAPLRRQGETPVRGS